MSVPKRCNVLEISAQLRCDTRVIFLLQIHQTSSVHFQAQSGRLCQGFEDSRTVESMSHPWLVKKLTHLCAYHIRFALGCLPDTHEKKGVGRSRKAHLVAEPSAASQAHSKGDGGLPSRRIKAHRVRQTECITCRSWPGGLRADSSSRCKVTYFSAFALPSTNWF